MLIDWFAGIDPDNPDWWQPHAWVDGEFISLEIYFKGRVACETFIRGPVLPKVLG